MSDTDRDSAVRVLVFVSDGGTTVGIGKEDAEGMVGVCLATLEAPVTLPEWLEALRIQPDPEKAADDMVQRHGGSRIYLVTRLQEATVLPPLAGGPVGEA